MSNENENNVITKNPLVSLIVVVVIVGIIVLIIKMRGSEEAFSPSDKKEIVENFPQSTPMNVMYSDSNGNLGTTTDLGLQNLTVKGESNLNGNVLSGDVFGGGSQVKTETIVAGQAYGGRLHLLGDNVYVMAKNGVHIATDPNSRNPWGASNGNLTVDGGAAVGGAVSAGSINTGGSLSANGKVIIGGDLGSEFNVNKPSAGWSTQFNNPTGGARIYMAHGDKHGMHINANNKDMDTYALQCNAGDKHLMTLNGKGNMSLPGSLSTGTLSSGSVSTSSVNIYNYGDVKTKLDELFAKVASLENSTVKKNQRFSLEQTNTWSGGNNTWYKIAMSDACVLRAINAGCGGDNWGDNNNFKIVQ